MTYTRPVIGPECADWSKDTEKLRLFPLLDCAFAGIPAIKKKKAIATQVKIFPKDIVVFFN
jgi:hypothetical protein